MIRALPRSLAASGIAILCLAAGGFSASAGDFGIRDEAFDDPNYDFKIDTELTVGQLSGTSHERFYDPLGSGHKYSELIWTMDDVAVVSGKVSIKPSNWWSVEMGATTNVTDDATMDDYDWLNLGSTDWTHWSHHNETNLDRKSVV